MPINAGCCGDLTCCRSGRPAATMQATFSGVSLCGCTFGAGVNSLKIISGSLSGSYCLPLVANSHGILTPACMWQLTLASPVVGGFFQTLGCTGSPISTHAFDTMFVSITGNGGDSWSLDIGVVNTDGLPPGGLTRRIFSHRETIGGASFCGGGTYSSDLGGVSSPCAAFPAFQGDIEVWGTGGVVTLVPNGC